MQKTHCDNPCRFTIILQVIAKEEGTCDLWWLGLSDLLREVKQLEMTTSQRLQNTAMAHSKRCFSETRLYQDFLGPSD